MRLFMLVVVFVNLHLRFMCVLLLNPFQTLICLIGNTLNGSIHHLEVRLLGPKNTFFLIEQLVQCFQSAQPAQEPHQDVMNNIP